MVAVKRLTVIPRVNVCYTGHAVTLLVNVCYTGHAVAPRVNVCHTGHAVAPEGEAGQAGGRDAEVHQTAQTSPAVQETGHGGRYVDLDVSVVIMTSVSLL